MANAFPPPEATIAQYGDLVLDTTRVRPLDTVNVRVVGRTAPGFRDTRATIRVYDDSYRLYCEKSVELSDNVGDVAFVAAGALGVHRVSLFFPGDVQRDGTPRHSRYANLRVDVKTHVETGDPDFDSIVPVTESALQLSRRAFDTERGRFVGYISGDTWQIDGVWLRDWIYQLPAYRSWEREMQCGLDRFLEKQNDDGSIPDGIRRDGTTWRAAVESDVEYILVLGVWETWKVTGDMAWMKRALPRLERALDYVRNDEMRWDNEHQLVKRGHTCDTWDFEIRETSEFVGKRFVVATCDQSGYVLAFRAMADMYRNIGETFASDRWTLEADEYARRANALLWDGEKYRHHVHLTPLDHPGFVETDQLAMGNTWAVTRGLADSQQARSVIAEYRRRHDATGDAHPWWSLQPGYPGHLEYYDAPYLRQGGYANGGLMPWVGGELCRGALISGMEQYGVDLIRDYVAHLRKTGNRVHVWYWPNGEAGMRTTNEVPHTGWGMAEWYNALIEGIAGIRDIGVRLDTVEVAPRWVAADVESARVALRYAANDAYIAYRMQRDNVAKRIDFAVSGSGDSVRFKVLLPNEWIPHAVTVVDSESTEFELTKIGESRYVEFESAIDGLVHVSVLCKP